MINDKDTPILVTYNDGKGHLILYRNEKKEKTRNVVRFIIVIIMDFMCYLGESVFMGMKGLKKW